MQTVRVLWLAGLLAVVTVLPVHATASGPQRYAVTRVAGTDSLMLRATASARARVLAQIPFNAVNVLNLWASSNGWCKVQYARTTGWAACKYLTESDGNRYYATQGYSDLLNIRTGPGLNARVVGTVPALETGLQGTGECNNDWCPVDYQGKRGWVGRKYLSSWSF